MIARKDEKAANTRPELQELELVFQDAARFSAQWPEEYRATVFELTATHLLGGRRPAAGGGPNRVSEITRDNDTDALSRLAQAIGADEDQVRRVMTFSPDGRIRIIGRVAGASRRELQRKYSVMFAFAKEKAFGGLQIDVQELRQLCTDLACYDMANFISNYRIDGLLREVGAKGSKERQYVASKEALVMGEALLRELINAET